MVNIKLIRETSTGTITTYITLAEARRGLRDGKYTKELLRDASGRIRGSQLRERYIAPSDSHKDVATITLADMRANVGEIDDPIAQRKTAAKIRMWHAVPMCVWPPQRLRA